MSQSRRMSFVESCVNVAIGYGVAVASQVLVFPWFGIHVPLRDNFLIGLWFTLISIVRSYAIRRLFNFNGWSRSKICKCGHRSDEHNVTPDYLNTACVFMSCHCDLYRPENKEEVPGGNQIER